MLIVLVRDALQKFSHWGTIGPRYKPLNVLMIFSCLFLHHNIGWVGFYLRTVVFKNYRKISLKKGNHVKFQPVN